MFYRPNFRKFAAFAAQQKAEAAADFRIVEMSLSTEELDKKLRRLFPTFYPTPKVPPS